MRRWVQALTRRLAHQRMAGWLAVIRTKRTAPGHTPIPPIASRAVYQGGRSLARKRNWARQVLRWEQVYTALWPVGVTLGILFSLMLLGLPAHLSLVWHLLLLAGFAVATIGLLWRGRAAWQRPDDEQVDRRLERDSGLIHQPLATLADHLAGSTPVRDDPEFQDFQDFLDPPDNPRHPATQALWRAHQDHARAQLTRLRARLPHTQLRQKDRWHLRTGTAVLVLISLGVAGREAPQRLRAGLIPDLFSIGLTSGVQMQAWVTPPAYTGLPPLFLPPDAQAPIAVPEGSHVSLSLSGVAGRPSLSFDHSTIPFTALAPQSWQAECDLNTNGTLSVGRFFTHYARWQITLAPDTPPTVEWAAPPGPLRPPHYPDRSRVSASVPPVILLPWLVTDNYGVTHLSVELRRHNAAPLPSGLAHPEVSPAPNTDNTTDLPETEDSDLHPSPSSSPDAKSHTLTAEDGPVLRIPLPLSGQPREARSVSVLDLSANPWAGLEVDARLVATDASGHSAQSDDMSLTLPQRVFHHPLARTVIALRQALTQHPDQRAPVIQGLGMIAARPDAFDNDTGIYLNLSALISLLTLDDSPQAISQAQDQMWDLAIALDEDTTTRTARALRTAYRQVQDQINRMTAPDAQAQGHSMNDPAAVEEFARRLEKLRERMAEHTLALLRQARRDPGGIIPPEHGLTPELERKTQDAETSARHGDGATARQDVTELGQMLNQLHNQTPAQQQMDANRAQGRQHLEELRQVMRQQADLLDHTQNRLQRKHIEQFGATENLPDLPPDPAFNTLPHRRADDEDPDEAANPGNNSNIEQMPAPVPLSRNDAANRQQDASSQQALQKRVADIARQTAELTGHPATALQDAQRAMRESTQALAEGRDHDAGQAQQRALRQLQQGGQQVQAQMDRRFGEDPSQGDGGGQGAQGGTGAQGNENAAQGAGENGLNGTVDERDENAIPRDPLGRPIEYGTAGGESGGGPLGETQGGITRSRALRDELRHRAADRTRPQPELDYINRLLKNP